MRRSWVRRSGRTWVSRRGLAAPVSLLLILFSLTMVSTLAYSYSIRRIGNRRQDLKLIATEEKMLDLDDAIQAMAWSPGSRRVLAFSDYDGQLRMEPDGSHLQINVTMGVFTETIFDADTGLFIYELPSTTIGHYGRWLRGDDEAVVNRSTAVQAQMWVSTGDEYEELNCRHRPLVSSSLGDLVGGRRVNNIRIYVINLNTSEAIESGGKFYVNVGCDNVTTQVRSYDLNSSVTVLQISVDIASDRGNVMMPLTTGASGSTVNVEVVVSRVKIEGVLV